MIYPLARGIKLLLAIPSFQQLLANIERLHQQLRDNADSRPYWQYSAVGDSRTRPSHQQLNGLVYRYDDPFWHTFFPPNGFNCRCTVVALAKLDIERKGIEVGNGQADLMDYVRTLPSGQQQQTKAVKLGKNQYLLADKGFDYNVGRASYRPNLDHYPTALAHQFAKREMSGASFNLDFMQFESEFKAIKNRLKINDKLNATQLNVVRNQLRREYKFVAGVLSAENKQVLASQTATVWLSDDSLIKQFESREGQAFGVDEYQHLPELIHSPEKIINTREKHYQLIKQINEKKYSVVLKVLANEIFVQSFRKLKDKEWRKLVATR